MRVLGIRLLILSSIHQSTDSADPPESQRRDSGCVSGVSKQASVLLRLVLG